MSTTGANLGSSVRGAVSEQVDRFMRSADEAQHAFEALAARVAELKHELDETNRHLNEKVAELDRLSGFQASLLYHLAEAVIAVDCSGTIRLFNPAAERMTGRRAAEWTGQPVSGCFVGEAELRRLLDEALAGRSRSPRVPVTLSPAGRKSLPAFATATAVRDRSQEVAGAVVVLYDRAEVSELRQQVSRNQSLAEIGRLAAVVAHEIRNPLGGIEGFAALLVRDLASSPAQRHAALILEGVRDLNRIMSSLLDFGKAEELRCRDVDLNALLRDLTDLVKADAQRSGTNVRVDLRSDVAAPHLWADAGALRQMFLNLLQNGIQAAAASNPAEISMRIGRDHIDNHAALAVEVSDNGPGIAPEIQDALFTPFVTTKHKGTGLGLATVRKLADAHGGKIELVSTGGAGARFRVLLPVQPCLK